jgi:hypothetical protein
MVDSFWLIEFFKLKQAYAYFYIALIFHTLVADFYAFRLLFAPKRCAPAQRCICALLF